MDYPYDLITDIEDDLNAEGVYLRPTESIAYGEMWNFTANVSAWTFSFASDNVYYNLTGLAEGNVHRAEWTENSSAEGGSYLTILEPNTYQINLAFSFSSVGKGLYGVSVARNFDKALSRNCYARRDIESHDKVGSAVVSCILELDRFDTINVQVEDEMDPTKDILIHQVNLNVVQIKD